ncbi:alkyl hydroperoxide reductase [Catenovulum agarivorans DS-2]|uniref:thioredoxin-dependent peroxiredoxin n=1 Tax=Catenovulum agarivorans DS-2 TaxID=1328313 RepID=W7QJT5_9ALTE|nr:peroxiredoxin-like family protein [Catenovulum agarivorans]EWH08398.1 alkyl hydroperoxide reductase [Catenovulum agarivorans DS-2]
MKFRLWFSVVMLMWLSGCSVADIDDRYLSKDAYNGVEAFNLNTGDNIASVALKDGQGEQFNLRNLANKQNLLLVIYRGEWCPFCVNQLESFEAVLPELKNHNTRLVAISPDDEATTKNTQKQFGQGYLFLTDPELKFIDSLGLKKDQTTPHPATILVKKGGEVVWFYVDKDYKTRPTGEQIRTVLQKFL